MTQLLATSENILTFSTSFAFDERVSKLDDQSSIMHAVQSYAEQTLDSLLMIYDKIPETIKSRGVEVFPIHKWNITSLPDCQDKKQNAKAVGLFLAYISSVRAYIEQRNGRMDKSRAEFLDSVIFGNHISRVSMKIIRVVCLFFSQIAFGLYDGENDIHAMVRNFIDNDYGFYFIDSAIGTSYIPDPEEPPEERRRKLFESFHEEENERDKRTLDFLTIIYKVLLNKSELTKIKNEVSAIREEISGNNSSKNKYKYQTNILIVRSNLDDLGDVISKSIAYSERKKSKKQ